MRHHDRAAQISTDGSFRTLTVAPSGPPSRAIFLRTRVSLPGDLERRALSDLARSSSAADAGARLHGMSEKGHFTAEQARATGERIGIDWATSPFDVEQLRMGMDVELEHGTRDLSTNVTDDDVTATAKIARAHLNEFPDYYSRLADMEAEAETYWALSRGE
jgi:hypothetical protein